MSELRKNGQCLPKFHNPPIALYFLFPFLYFLFRMESNNIPLQASGYQIDSRLILPGNLFFAIRGAKHDGHDFLKQVRSLGAYGAVVAKNYLGEDFGLRLFRVDDVGDTLRNLAQKSLAETKIQIVGVTGSVGKTTTKDFIATLLEGKFRVGKTNESQNSKLTFPLTILNRARDVEVLVLEMGMSEMGDIERLVKIAPPDVAVLTKVGLAHAAYFPGGVEEIARGKLQIFSHPKTFAIADSDYGLPRVSIFRGEDYSIFQEAHLNHNFAAAVEVARYFGMTHDEIQGRIPFLQLPKMRLEKIEKNGILFINDAYNANPESMKAALLCLQTCVARKKIAVLGSMLELGKFSAASHREIGERASQIVDHLLVIGNEWTYGERFIDHESLSVRLKEIMGEGDVVLIKGSRGMCMEKVLCYCGS